MNRRSLLKYITLGGGIAAAGVAGWATGGYILGSSKKDNREVIKQIEEQKDIIIFKSTYGKKIENPNHLGTLGTQYEPGTRKDVQIKFVVGPDGHLYLNQNGGWAKVLIET